MKNWVFKIIEVVDLVLHAIFGPLGRKKGDK